MSTPTTPAESVLPVSTTAETRRSALDLVRRDRGSFVLMLGLNAAAAAAGLVGPWLLGRIINTVQAGGGVRRIDELAVLILGAAVVQLLLTRWARYVGARFGERVSTRVRERFLDRILQLPSPVVERVATGDLAARGTGDVAAVAATMRDAGPDVLIAVVQAAVIVVAVFVVSPLLGLCGVAGLLGVWFATRWYLRRARTAYLAQGAANSALAETLAATAAGARTVEALGLQERRIRQSLDAIAACRETRLRTLSLRSVLFPVVDISYVIPVVAVLLVGGWLYDAGSLSLGAVVASALYLRQLAGPLEALELWVDQLQSSAASFARLEGLGHLTPSQPVDGATPTDDRIEVDAVHYAYGAGRDVLRGVDLSIRPGERLAVVGPSGAGKSTLGRLLAGLAEPRAGSVTVGGVPVSRLPPDQLRRQIVLVTQEHHVFHASVRDNLLIARPSATEDELVAALQAVGAGTWWAELPAGLDTDLGPGDHPVDAGQAQQLALARVVLADPHTVVLDEATAMMDPTTARSTERALSAVLSGRTVLAIAHRLHTAHDAHRVAVVADGRITQLGTHDELVAVEGAYADLWRSWHG